MVPVAVKTLLKEGAEVGSCDFGVQSHWKSGGKIKGRRKGRKEQAAGKKEGALGKKVNPTHPDGASSRETTFHVVTGSSILGTSVVLGTTEFTEVIWRAHQPQFQDTSLLIQLGLPCVSLPQHGSTVSVYIASSHTDCLLSTH